MQGKVDHVQVLRKPRAMALRVLVVLGVHLVLSGVQSNLIPRIVSTSSLLELAVPVSEKIQNERCRNHSALYLNDLKKLKLWATEMFDATSKFPSGILSGSTYGMGNYDECLKVKVPLKNDSFSGKYCLATLKIELENDFEENAENRYQIESEDRLENFNVSVWRRVMVLSNDRSKRLRNELKWSFCIPSSCLANDLLTHLKEVSETLSITNNFQVTPYVDEQNCHVSSDFPIETSDIIFVVFVLSFLIATCIATFYDLHKNSRDTTKKFDEHTLADTLLKSFSFTRNLKKLAIQQSSAERLDCISGLKVFSMFLIIMGHRIMFILGAPAVNSDYIESFYGKIDATVLLNGPIIVDTFFVISGFLACYLLLNEFTKRGRTISFFKLYLHRLIRLLPSYVFMLAFYCTLLVKLGSGPLWKEKVGIERERCRESWWTNLLFINNYVYTDKICMFQSWFITCDMHFFLVTPFLVWLLWKKEKHGLIALVILTILSVTSTYLVVFFKRLDAILLLYMRLLKDPIADKTFRNIYIPTHTRATPYFVGMLTAYAKYKIKNSNFKFTNRIVYPTWIITTLLLLITIYSAYFFYIPGNYDVHASAVYASFHHLTWSACISWLILALSTGNGSWIEPILSWKGLTPLNRITYCAFLCHGAIQLYSVATLRQPHFASIFNLIWYSFGDISLAYLLGLILCLLFESPVIGLEKLIFHRNAKAMPSRNLEEKPTVIVTNIRTTSAA